MDNATLYGAAALLEMGARAKFAEAQVAQQAQRISELEQKVADLEAKLKEKEGK